MPGAKERELSIPNDTKYLATVREAVADIIEHSDFPVDDLNRIVLAVDEAVANIIEHGYSNSAQSEADIEVKLYADNERFEVSILDFGQSFDPNEMNTPDMAEHVRQGKKSGLGIYLMRKIMDQIDYRFEGTGRNELIMTKYAKPGSGA